MRPLMKYLLFLLVVQSPLLADEPGRAIASSAAKQVGVTKLYDGRYVALEYPNGDIPIERGVCTDVVIRAFRESGMDLQKLVHEDMQAGWKEYPKLWGLMNPDRNIDHRRVPNLAKYFERHGYSLPITNNPDDYQPGDLVTWKLPSGVPHIGIVAEEKTSNRPLIIHNIGAGAKVEDILFAFTITGHFRIPAN